MSEWQVGKRTVDLANNQYSRSLLSDEDYERLNEKGLFIVGSARSGTTILCRCLNVSKDIYLLEEANLFLTHDRDDFVEYFNAQHIAYENYRTKGTFIPPIPTSGKSGFAFLAQMSRRYRYVGEKVAFGVSDQPLQELFFMFQAKYFYYSTYFLTIRHPVEVAWSMSKMFPEFSKEQVFMSWLKTLKIIIDIYETFPKAYVLFFEDLNANTVSVIGEMLILKFLLIC